MIELLIVLLVLWVVFGGPGAGWGAYPRGGLLTVVVIIVLLWLFLGPHHASWYY